MNQTQEELEAWVREDIRCHLKNNVSLDPFSTYGARGSWQRGFDGKPRMLGDHGYAHERGALAAILIKEATP